ncbi:MAG: hypothetical protein H5U10_13720 [Desulfacinum sp.]|jgi:formylmethanofuran dehydrogenase subunit E-like metal-binding protein|nr:hypothetical protein [Desulfacinum sp.]
MKSARGLKKRCLGRVALCGILLWMACPGLWAADGGETTVDPSWEYERWKRVGEAAAELALGSFEKMGLRPRKGDLVVMTNAGYAEVDGRSTQAVLDGLASVTGSSRGRHSLVEVHSAPWAPLWCAVYDRSSGWNVYLELDPSRAAAGKETAVAGLFRPAVMERIDSEHVLAHPSSWDLKIKNKVFGGNEFRILTIANAVAAGAPTAAVRAVEFHDHYCPGVASGILMAQYLKAHFPPGEGGYFVHAVKPWCKEDALLVLLNATPGKRAYAVDYPTKEDEAGRLPEASEAATIVYRLQKDGGGWEGRVLAFSWAETPCPKTGSALMDKLCADLWYLKQMEHPERYVKVLKDFRLPDGVSPRDWAAPGVDPLKMLGLMQTGKSEK